MRKKMPAEAGQVAQGAARAANIDAGTSAVAKEEDRRPELAESAGGKKKDAEASSSYYIVSVSRLLVHLRRVIELRQQSSSLPEPAYYPVLADRLSLLSAEACGLADPP